MANMKKPFLIGISAVLLILNLLVWAEKGVGGGMAKVNQDSIDSARFSDSLAQAWIDSTDAAADTLYQGSFDSTAIASEIEPYVDSMAFVEDVASNGATINLSTGAKPWRDYYYHTRKGDSSDIIVQTGGSQVVVTIKHDDRVVDHAYIAAGDSYTFKLQNGVYQVFFYYGSEWSPEKPMPNGVYGGFLSGEFVSKYGPVNLYFQSLIHTLNVVDDSYLQEQSSNLREAL